MHDNLYEQTIDDKLIYDGRIVELRELTVRLPNGKKAKREVVYHPGAVAVLAEPAPGELVLVEQFRKAPDEVLLEVPAGKLDPDESPRDCAKRELLEETGYRCGQMEEVYSFFTSPGFANEKIVLFYARQLVDGEARRDEDEFLRLRRMSRNEVEECLNSGGFRDAKTLIAVLWWLSRTSAKDTGE